MAFNYNVLIKENALLNAAGASKKEISSAMTTLKVEFADDYLDFLMKVGACIFRNHEIVGISAFEDMNVTDVTLKAREYNPQVPSNLYVIEEPHFDDIFIWQDSSGAIYQTYPNQKPKKIAGSLTEYLGLSD